MALSSSMLGVTISLIANLLINVGLNVQKVAHEEAVARRGSVVARESVHGAEAGAFCSLRWVSGLVIQLTGESGNMVAYSFAATSIIAPLGAVGLLANLAIATFFLGEPFRRRDVVGALLAGGGAALVAVFAPSNTLEMTNHEMLHDVILQWRAIYLAAVFVVGVALWVSARVWRHHPRVSRFLGISACFATFTIFAIKGVSLILRNAIEQHRFTILLHSPVFLGLIPVAVVSGPCQIFWLNQGLAVFSASAVVPTYYVFFSLSAIVVGGLVYGDFDHMHYRNISFFATGVVMCIAGVFAINSGRGDLAFEALDGADVIDDDEEDEFDDYQHYQGPSSPEFKVKRTMSSPSVMATPIAVHRTRESAALLSPRNRNASVQSFTGFTLSPAVAPRRSVGRVRPRRSLSTAT